MEKFTQEIFKRATLQGVADYVLKGQTIEQENQSYETRLDNAYYKYEATARTYAEEKASKLIDSANEMASVTADVYTEIGIQAGILLIQDFLRNIGQADYKGMYEQLFESVKEALQLIKSGEQDKVEEAVELLERSTKSLGKLQKA